MSALAKIDEDQFPRWTEIDDIDLPPVPDWCKGAHIDFMWEYASSPYYYIKTNGDVGRWENEVYERIQKPNGGVLYLALHEDGRAKHLYHNGKLTWETVKVMRRCCPPVFEDPVNEKHRLRIGYPEDFYRMGVFEKHWWMDQRRLCSTKQDGFGGSDFDIDAYIDGKIVPVRLRGPWHGGLGPSFIEVTCGDISNSYSRPRGHNPRPWYTRASLRAVHLKMQTFLAIMARFAPHLRFAVVEEKIGDTIFRSIQPLDPELWVPKCAIPLDVRNERWGRQKKERR